jgi:hypothetical protein
MVLSFEASAGFPLVSLHYWLLIPAASPTEDKRNQQKTTEDMSIAAGRRFLEE